MAYATPPQRADTEFVDTRAVDEDLPQAMKDKVEGLRVDHDLFRALQRNGVKFEDEEMRRNYPRKIHPLVRTSASGRKALYMGWHGVGIEGIAEPEALELLDELYRFATQPKYPCSNTEIRNKQRVIQA